MVRIEGQSIMSADHKVSIARGDLHTWSNVQLAHRLCNTRKGVRFVENHNEVNAGDGNVGDDVEVGPLVVLAENGSGSDLNLNLNVE